MFCIDLLRYEEYIIFTQFPIYARLSTNDLQRFLEATDDEMARYLENSVLSEGPRVIP